MAQGSAQDSEDIDKIIQEIEGMEKELDNVSATLPKDVEKQILDTAGAASAASAADPVGTPVAPVAPAAPTAPAPVPSVAKSPATTTTPSAAETAAPSFLNVVSLHPPKVETPVTESLAESDAVMATHEPLAFERGASGEGNLGLKVGGCTSISLEFEQAGMRISLRLEGDTLSISTENGAEFRLPLRRAAA